MRSGVGHDPAVIRKDVDVVLCGQQRADVGLEHELGLHRALDRFLDLSIRSVDQVTHALADRLLPCGKPSTYASRGGSFV
jgi:hypothetical protein